MSELSRAERLALALATLLVVATALSIAWQAGSWSPPLDDAYIHAAFARHLAERLQWGVGAGGPDGESSPGFPLLLAASEIGPLAASPQFALLLGGLAFIALPLCAARLFERAQRGLVAPFCALGGTLLLHAQSGMETLPYLTLGCAALWAFRAGSFRLAGLLAAGAAWMRLDAWALWLALGLGALDHLRAQGQSWGLALRRVLVDFFPGLCLSGAALLWLSVASGHFPPATLGGRRWLLGLDPQWSLAGVGEGVMPFLRRWLAALSAQFGFGFLHAPHFDAAPWAWSLRQLWKLAAALALCTGLLQLLRLAAANAARAAPRLLVVWTLWTLLQYCLLLPARGHAGRYQPQILLLFLILLALAWPVLWRRLVLKPFALLLLAGVLGASVQSVVLSGRASAHLQRVHRSAAAEIALQPGEVVAVFDIGVWAYRRDDRWVDLSGLADRELLQALEDGQLPGQLLRRGVSHLLLPLTENDGPGSLRDRLGLSELDGVTMQPLREWQSRDADWAPAFRLSGNAARRLVLYRIWPYAGAHAHQRDLPQHPG